MSGFKEERIYQRAYQAARAAYRITRQFPKFEMYAMGDQIRRAALSIPLNIAEGYGRRSSQAEYRHFLLMALGSADEMQVLVEFAHDEEYIDQATYENAVREYEEIAKMINAYVQAVGKHI